MSTIFECDWCGKRFSDRAAVASVDVTVQSVAENVHMCHGCLPDWISDQLDPLDGEEVLVTDGGTDLVTACPECTHHNVRQRDDGTWRCGECEAEFSRPMRRARRHGGGNYSAAGEALRHADPDDLRADGGVYKVHAPGVSVVDGVEVDLTVRAPGGDERRADQVLFDLKERLGRLAAAYDTETPPAELPDELDSRYVPPMTIAWDTVFDDDLRADGGVRLGAGEQTLYAAKCIECGQVDTYVAEEAVSEGDERDNYCTRCPGFETVRVTKVWERDGDE